MYTLYESGSSKWYYDNTNGKIVVFDKTSNSVGFQLNATYILIIVAVAFIMYEFTKWYG